MTAPTTEPWRPHPMLQMAIQSFLGSDPQHREDIVELVCETLGVRPGFWSKEPAAPPVNLACLVRIGDRDSRSYSIAIFNEGKWTTTNGQPVGTIAAWAEIPD